MKDLDTMLIGQTIIYVLLLITIITVLVLL